MTDEQAKEVINGVESIEVGGCCSCCSCPQGVINEAIDIIKKVMGEQN